MLGYLSYSSVFCHDLNSLARLRHRRENISIPSSLITLSVLVSARTSPASQLLLVSLLVLCLSSRWMAFGTLPWSCSCSLHLLNRVRSDHYFCSHDLRSS